MPLTPADIHHDPTGQRFELQVDGLGCELIYRLQGHTMQIDHTGVPPALRGRGIAAVLMQAALDHARTAGWRVRPHCSYALAYLRRHPESQDLLAPR